MFKKDNLKFGLLLGAFAPILGMLGFYLWKFRIYKLIDFLQFLFVEKRLLTSMISFSLMTNAILFTIFINGHRDKTAKGIFLITCIYAIIAIVIKFVY